MKEKICCFTGHRPNGFLWDYDKKHSYIHKEYLTILKKLIKDAISQGYNYFISGGAIGADMDCAEIVIKLRKKQPNIFLEIAVPCKQQDLKWGIKDKKRYKAILKKANMINIISEKYTNTCMQERNEYMVDKAKKIIFIYNRGKKGGTLNTLKYAKRKEKEMQGILFFAIGNKIEIQTVKI